MRNHASIAIAVGAVLASVVISGCQPEVDPVSSPSPRATASSESSGELVGIDHESWQLDPGDVVVESLSGKGAEDRVIDTSGIGRYLAVYAQCTGEDIVVDVIYEDDDPSEAFTPHCDGVMNRERVHVDPAEPVDEVRVVVTGAGDWAVVVVKNEGVAASIESGG